MNIGLVSTWFERGAAYVTKSYMQALEKKYNTYIYARGGERYAKGDPNWDFENVTWSPKLVKDFINYNHIKKWINQNKISVLFFNEQKDSSIIYKLKRDLPEIKIGSYIDYYKENTVKEFFLYDFLICNTKRHYSVFKHHPQSYYIPWGTDTELFLPKEKPNNNRPTFFHSAGMSLRKGTNFVIDAFIKGKLFKDANLVIHIQSGLQEKFGYNPKELKKYNIDVIEKTVSAPGLYYLGDVYVYPTMLDGLGLTMYEALSSGLPVIATNHPPMNEVINQEVGYLVDVDTFRSRGDGYYWPLSIINLDSLIKAMKFFVDNPLKLKMMKETARKNALNYWNLKDRAKEIIKVFEESKVIVKNPDIELLNKTTKLEKIERILGSSYLYGLYHKFFK